MKSRIFATAAIAIALAIGVATPAFATASYTGGLDQNSSAPGGTVTYTAETGQPEGTPADYSLNGPTTTDIQPSSLITHTATVAAKGHLTFSVKIPKNAKPGSTYQLHVNSGTFKDTQKIHILGVLASVGSAFNPIPLVIGLVAVLVIAFIIVFLVLRRRTGANTAV
jgi:hypothetical protein